MAEERQSALATHEKPNKTLDMDEPPNSPAFPVEPRDRFDDDGQTAETGTQLPSASGSMGNASLPGEPQRLDDSTESSTQPGYDNVNEDSYHQSLDSASVFHTTLPMLVNDDRPAQERRISALQEAAELLRREADEYLWMRAEDRYRPQYQGSWSDRDVADTLSEVTSYTAERRVQSLPPAPRVRDFALGSLGNTESTTAFPDFDQPPTEYSELQDLVFQDGYQNSLSDGEFANCICFDKHACIRRRSSVGSATIFAHEDERPVFTQGYGEYALDIDGGMSDSEYLKEYMSASRSNTHQRDSSLAEYATSCRPSSPEDGDLADVSTETLESWIAELSAQRDMFQHELEKRYRRASNSTEPQLTSSGASCLRGGVESNEGSRSYLASLSTAANDGSNAQNEEAQASYRSFPPPDVVTQEQREEAANYYFQQASRQGFDHARLMSLEYLRGKKDHKIPALLSHASLEKARRMQENEGLLFARALHLDELREQREYVDKPFADPAVKKALQTKVDRDDDHDADDEWEDFSHDASATGRATEAAKGKQPLHPPPRYTPDRWEGKRLRKHRETRAGAWAALMGDSTAASSEQANPNSGTVPRAEQDVDGASSARLDSATYHSLLQAKQAEVDEAKRDLAQEKSQPAHDQASQTHVQQFLATQQAGFPGTDHSRSANQFFSASALESDTSIPEQTNAQTRRQTGLEDYFTNCVAVRQEHDLVSAGTMSDRSSFDSDASVGTSSDSDEYK